MNHQRRYTIRLLALLCLTITLNRAEAQTVRGIRDSVGFCWNASEMTRLIQFLDSIQEQDTVSPSPFAAISPHDDYLYAARVYHPLFKALRTQEVVIFGVTHGAVRREIGDPKNILLLEQHAAWTGPYGRIQPSPLRDLIASTLDTSMMRIDDHAHSLEHSIEALLPFLQHYNRKIRITPIMVTAMPFGRMDTIATELSSIILAYMHSKHLQLGKDISILMSSDANHYGRDFGNTPWGEDETGHRRGVMEDTRILRSFIDGALKPQKIESLWNELQSVLWCGRYSVPFGLLTVEKIVHDVGGRACHGTTYRYSDTFTEGVLPIKNTVMGTTAPFSLQHWVGFFFLGFEQSATIDTLQSVPIRTPMKKEQ